MEVNSIDEIQLKQDLKTCSKSVRDYVKALQNLIEIKDHTIKKALAKIKELSPKQ